MATVHGWPNIDLRLTLQINEEEARALEAMAGYGTEEFIRVFYEKLGKAYMEKHESGLRTFLDSVRRQVPSVLGRIDDARDVFKGSKIAAFPIEKGK